MPEGDRGYCEQHFGLLNGQGRNCRDIQTLFKSVDAIKTRQSATLLAVCLTLLGIIVSIILQRM